MYSPKSCTCPPRMIDEPARVASGPVTPAASTPPDRLVVRPAMVPPPPTVSPVDPGPVTLTVPPVETSELELLTVRLGVLTDRLPAAVNDEAPPPAAPTTTAPPLPTAFSAACPV